MIDDRLIVWLSTSDPAIAPISIFVSPIAFTQDLLEPFSPVLWLLFIPWFWHDGEAEKDTIILFEELKSCLI